eukprot:SAG22_NODE_5066_length_1094_cov_1.692462_1_plen_39_part_10
MHFWHREVWFQLLLMSVREHLQLWAAAASNVHACTNMYI